MSQDRRRYARADKNLAIKIRDKDADFVTETKNISCLGAYCEVDGYVPILTKLKITLLLPKSRNLKDPKHIACEGTVVRVEKSPDPLENNKYNIGIYFNQINRSDMKMIDRYIKNCMNEASRIRSPRIPA
ncbi:MAG: PilZ domain-containing protein [Candidatus Omnitrophota bacterium]